MAYPFRAAVTPAEFLAVMTNHGVTLEEAPIKLKGPRGEVAVIYYRRKAGKRTWIAPQPSDDYWLPSTVRSLCSQLGLTNVAREFYELG